MHWNNLYTGTMLITFANYNLKRAAIISNKSLSRLPGDAQNTNLSLHSGMQTNKQLSQ